MVVVVRSELEMMVVVRSEMLVVVRSELEMTVVVRSEMVVVLSEKPAFLPAFVQICSFSVSCNNIDPRSALSPMGWPSWPSNPLGRFACRIHKFRQRYLHIQPPIGQTSAQK
jgi:hypothetical protein